MEIKWGNVLVVVVAVLAFVLLLHARGPLSAVIQTVETMAPGNPPEERLKGFLVLGLICITIVASIKLLTQNRSR